MVPQLLAVVLLVVSLTLVYYLASLLWQAARLPLGALFERRRAERYIDRARRGDRHLENGSLGPALHEYEAASCPYPARDREVARALSNHHTGLLSRFIAAADHLQGERVRLMSLAKADRLFQERNVLQGRYLTLLNSGSRRRLQDLDRELRANAKELRSALANLTHEITTVEEAVRYH
jgi:hypothetical protein